jgi:hypothetical protein
LLFFTIIVLTLILSFALTLFKNIFKRTLFL